MDRQQYNSQQLRQVESELNTANNKIRELREEMQKKQNHIMKLEADKVGQSVSKGPILTEQTNNNRERSGSVVECLTRDRRAAGSSFTGVTAMCP